LAKLSKKEGDGLMQGGKKESRKLHQLLQTQSLKNRAFLPNRLKNG